MTNNQKKFLFTDKEIEMIEEHVKKYDLQGSFQKIVKQMVFQHIREKKIEELALHDSELATKIKQAKDSGELIDILYDMGTTKYERLEIRKGLEQLEKWEENIKYRGRKI